MGGAAKKVTKPFKSIASGIGNLIKKSIDASVKPFKSAIGSLTPEMPDMPDSPLMPDLEAIEKSRRRRRATKMGRTETIMSSDVLGG